MPGNTLDTASVDQLLKAIRERFSYKSVTPEQASLKIYEEFFKRCDKLLKEYVKIINVKDKNIVVVLRYIAELCRKVDKAGNSNILASIEEVQRELSKLTDNVSYPNLPKSIVEYRRHLRNDLAANGLAKQAKGYLKEAFIPNVHTFDGAATKIEDASDILELSQCILAADLVRARDKSYLDTVVREDIPAAAWKWMEKNL